MTYDIRRAFAKYVDLYVWKWHKLAMTEEWSNTQHMAQTASFGLGIIRMHYCTLNHGQGQLV